MDVGCIADVGWVADVAVGLFPPHAARIRELVTRAPTPTMNFLRDKYTCSGVISEDLILIILVYLSFPVPVYDVIIAGICDEMVTIPYKMVTKVAGIDHSQRCSVGTERLGKQVQRTLRRRRSWINTRGCWVRRRSLF